MKRVIVGFSMIVCLAALLYACQKDDEPDKEEAPYFAIDAQSSAPTFGPAGGAAYVVVKTNQTFTVSSSASWCSAELTPNTTDSITIKAEQLNNPATRTATVTIACEGFDNAVVTVTQTGIPATLSVTPLQPETLSPEGGEVVITVSANAEWDYSVVETAGWLTEKAKTDTTLTLTVASNGAKSKRASDVTVFLTSYPEQKQEIVVSQEAAWESTLNVMTFNLRVSSAVDGRNHWSYRRDVATRVISENDIDIVGTQETESDQRHYLAVKLPRYRNVGLPGETGGGYNSVFFKKDRFVLLSDGTFWLSETPDVSGSKSWESGYVRMATWARLKDKATNKELFVINTHIDHISKAAQEKQVEVLLQKIEELHGDLPVILTGDFNMSPDNSNIVAITNASLSHTRDVAESKSGKDYTYHGFNETQVAGNYFADYIFTSDVGVRVYQHSVLPEKLDGVYVSDHTPVVAKIGIE